MAVRPQRQQKPAESPIDSKFQRGFALLLEARDYADRTASDAWEFAVEIHLLREIGLSDNDLRYLVRSQYLEHAHEVTAMGKLGRNFRSSGDLAFAKRTCFVLTPRGADAADDTLNETWESISAGLPTLHVSHVLPTLRRPCLPIWDVDRRILSWDGQVVKQFRRRAFNQEVVLAAFQEEDWPLRIYDPLAPQPCQDMKRRLNDTIKCLNRGQTRRLLHFRGDGTGEGVLWEVVT